MTKVTFTGLLLALMFVAALPVLADGDHEQARRLVESGDILPLETILKKYQASAPGDILEIEFEIEEGQPVYEIEWLDADGQVWEWKIDARNGEHIGLKKE